MCANELILKIFICMWMISYETMTTQADISICQISIKTVHNVPSCPKTDDEWREAAARKNCSQYASQCHEPDKLEYHCVLNPYINETLEVCAYPVNIVKGFCTEYSSIGNRIQPNYNAHCSTCPSSGYPSNHAFKYSECYNLVKTQPTNNGPKATDFATTESLNSDGKGDDNSGSILTFTSWYIIITSSVVLYNNICCNFM
uniref:Uncharacterized protein LOC111101824 n=1 Tax=Crassostrea virginica TaxID=6565 RepID=A0A8B8AHY3_CRAVI|nr:uncharacterized protein LOC111101824 [Crassostrea virginica]